MNFIKFVLWGFCLVLGLILAFAKITQGFAVSWFVILLVAFLPLWIALSLFSLAGIILGISLIGKKSSK